MLFILLTCTCCAILEVADHVLDLWSPLLEKNNFNWNKLYVTNNEIYIIKLIQNEHHPSLQSWSFWIILDPVSHPLMRVAVSSGKGCSKPTPTPRRFTWDA